MLLKSNDCKNARQKIAKEAISLTRLKERNEIYQQIKSLAIMKIIKEQMDTYLQHENFEVVRIVKKIR